MEAPPEFKYILNPETGRYVKTTGKKGRLLIGKDLCRLYPRNKNIQFAPRPHQEEALVLFKTMLNEADQNKDAYWRGILLYHGLGTGKTCSYGMMIDEYLSRPQYKNNKVYIFTSGALRTNFLEQYCGFCGQNTQNVGDTFVFFSYNYSRVRSQLPPDLNNSLIVIDELHHIINGKTNESPELSYIYNLIHNSVDSFIVSGSGSPLLSSYYNLYFIWKLLIRTGMTLEDYENMFVTDPDDVIRPKDDEDLRESLNGCIHYIAIPLDEHYPRVTRDYLPIPISKERYPQYEKIVNAEREVRPPQDRDRAMNPAKYRRDLARWYLAVSHLRSRQEGNFSYPVIPRDEKEGTPVEFGIPDKPLQSGGWIEADIIGNLDHHGEKILYILHDIQEHQYKHVIYTEFKTRYGSQLIGGFLDILQIPYRFFDGDMNDTDRQRVLAEFNAPNNIHGEQVQVLIITNAGAEGINLLEVQKFHILEQYISSWVLQQASGRAIRYNSHIRLPEDERVVHIRNYMLNVEPYGDNLKFSGDYMSLAQAQKKDHKLSYLQEFLRTL